MSIKNFLQKTTTKIPHIRKNQLGSRAWWGYLVVFFIGAFCASIVASSIFFGRLVRLLDASVQPSPLTNVKKIDVLERSLEEVQEAVDTRVGQ